ncbi:hypothetical protein Q8F55_000477 [Vanrija albida]|uniref:Uncharacterized protein n=1 Tax=Vanrija albida TaxID=181172 RepID=A0ABR3QDK0_9TREE
MDPAAASAIIAQFKVTYRGVLTDEAGYAALEAAHPALRIFEDTAPPTVVDLDSGEWWDVAPELEAAWAAAEAAAVAAGEACSLGEGEAARAALSAEEEEALFFKLLRERYPDRGPPPPPSA